MNTYLIQQKVKAIANLGTEFERAGYRFKAFDAKNPFGGEQWLAEKDVEGQCYQDASLAFRLGLIPILDALSVLTQCSFSFAAMSYLVRRLNDNESGVFYLYVAQDRKTVGMPLWDKEQLADLDRLLRFDNKVALHYLRESNNSSTAKTRLAMLVFAAEALAGQKEKARTCPDCGRVETFSTSNRELLAELLGKEAYDRLYIKDSGALRHKLVHGSVVPDKDIVEVVPLVYEKVILEYLPNLCGLQSVRKIAAAPRSFTSFDHGGLFVRPLEKSTVELPVAEQFWNRPSVLEPTDPPHAY
jgi:hypothetical protein